MGGPENSMGPMGPDSMPPVMNGKYILSIYVMASLCIQVTHSVCNYSLSVYINELNIKLRHFL